MSDDGGDTWRAGALLPLGWTECDVAELTNGSVLLTSRASRAMQRKGLRTESGFGAPRLFARSDDGGESWAALWEDPNLPDPTCMASLASDPSRGRTVFFANPSHPHWRVNFSLHGSVDGGSGWASLAALYDGGAAYSDLAVMDDGGIAFAFEKDGYQSIAFGVWRGHW